MLGVAAFGGAAVAYAGQGFGAQAVVAGLLAVAGCYGVHLWRAKNSKDQMASVDAGQPANFEHWIDQGGGLARVRYRGASWDANVDGAGELLAGTLLYVMRIEGHRLEVSRKRPD
jgi:membrane protein implicated in regulation of membrane protease activity